MSGNDLDEILASVRHWLVNGADGDLTDGKTYEDELERIAKLQALLKLHLRQELLSYKWRMR